MFLYSQVVFLWGMFVKIMVCVFFLAFRYSNIYITAPSPDNLKTFFEFVCKGFDALEYKVKQISFPIDY